MPFTPLHIAFAWPLKMKFKALNFASLTVGAMVPDFEPIAYAILGIYPDRLLMHSLVGALSVDVVLTIVILKLLTLLNFGKVGIHRLANPNLFSRTLILSASVGSLSHVLVDSLHHDHNPLLWPLGPTYFTGPMVLIFGNPLATNIVSLAALVIILFMVRRLMNRNGYGLSLIFKNPIKALSVVSSALDR
ncbi:MAG: DUF4184 family protein [Nitrososphaera sp.]